MTELDGSLVGAFPHADDVNGVAWAPNGQLLASGGRDSKVMPRDMSNSNPTPTPTPTPTSTPTPTPTPTPDPNPTPIPTPDQVMLRDTTKWKPVTRVGRGAGLASEDEVFFVGFSPDR